MRPVSDRQRLRLFLAVGLVVAAVSVAEGHSQTTDAATQRNIVVVMTDDQAADSVPVMRRLMSFPEGAWVRFTNAYAEDSLCCPSRSGVLSGQYSHHHGVFNNTMGAKFNDANALPVWLDNAGYRTGLVGKYLNGYPWDKGAGYIPPGWDFFRTSVGDTDGHSAAAVNFINTSTGPFFLYLAYRAPHRPAKPPTRYVNANVYIPPQSVNMNEADVSDKPTWIRNLARLTQSQISAERNERLNSQRALLAVDDGIQQVINALKAKGVLDNTLVIFLSDNGFSFGSHRHIGKWCVYEECGRVPLFVRYPGLTGNRHEPRLASTVDVPATILAYAGVPPGLPQDGRSLIPLITNTATGWTNELLLEAHISNLKTFYAIRAPGWTYAEYKNGEKELYDLAADPAQLQNQANKPAYQARQSALSERLRVLRNGASF